MKRKYLIFASASIGLVSLLVLIEVLPTYNRGPSLQGNPTVPAVHGVNIAGGAEEMPLELSKASQKFNVVRFLTTRFLSDFLAGNDSFSRILPSIPSNVKLVPTIFNMVGSEAQTVEYLIQNGKVSDWIQYWLKPEFQQHYLYIDVCNEPQPELSGNEWESTFLHEQIAYIKTLTALPITIGFHKSTPQTIAQEFIPEIDIVNFHFYSQNTTYIDEFKAKLSFYQSFGKPVVVEEFNLNSANEAAQATWVRNVLDVIKTSGIEGYMVWDLREPPQTGLYWGIYRSDWSPKPCVQLFP
jgi:hypothetical protein